MERDWTQRDSVAVLCSGPSLQRTYIDARPQHDLVIGVNRVVEAVRCDWWAFNDWETFKWRLPHLVGTPGICTSGPARKTIIKEGYGDALARHEVRTYDQLPVDVPERCRWTNFSMLVGLVLAACFTSKEIVLYGCDQQGVEDWDGPSPTRAIRTVHRWQNEINKFSKLQEWMKTRGLRFVHVRPEAASVAV